MRFEFHDLNELKGFLEWAGYVKAPAPNNTVAFDSANAPLPEISAPVLEYAAQVVLGDEQPDTPAPVEQKRKRRTKAEMEAARAAEQAGNASPAPDAATQVQATESGDSEGTSSNASNAAGSANPFAQPADDVKEAEPVTENDVRDAPDFIKSRLVERPEVSQVDHLNMARTFIGKHGMEKYNQSFALASLSNNVMGYSPADCAAHAAALDFLSLE